MAVPCGGLRALLLLAALVVATRQEVLCTLPCCQAAHHCEEITCHCPHRDIVLRKGDIPKEAVRVTVKDARRVIIASNVIENLEALRSFNLENLQQVELERDGLRLSRKTRLLSFAAINVSDVVVRASAFSGFWNRDTSIEFRSIKKLSIEENGIGFSSTRGGPKLAFQHVNELVFGRKSVAGAIRQVDISHSDIQHCDEGAFGKNVKNVALTNVNARCLGGFGALGTLSFNSCHIETLAPYSIHGEIQVVEMIDTKIGKISTNGLNVTVNELQFVNCSIQEMSSRALNVLSRRTISVRGVTIEILRKHAFMNTRFIVQQNFKPVYSINGLTVIRAEYESMKLHEGYLPSIEHLYVKPPEGVPCSEIHEWFRNVIGHDIDVSVNERLNATLKQLHDTCSTNGSQAASSSTREDALVTEVPVERSAGDGGNPHPAQSSSTIQPSSTMSSRPEASSPEQLGDGSSPTHPRPTVAEGDVPQPGAGPSVEGDVPQSGAGLSVEGASVPDQADKVDVLPLLLGVTIGVGLLLAIAVVVVLRLLLGKRDRRDAPGSVVSAGRVRSQLDLEQALGPAGPRSARDGIHRAQSHELLPLAPPPPVPPRNDSRGASILPFIEDRAGY